MARVPGVAGVVVGDAMKVVVTGANGFVGRALCARLAAAGHQVIGVVRRPVQLDAGVQVRVVPESAGDPVWQDLMTGTDAVVDLAVHHSRAGRADRHQMGQLRLVNVEAMCRMARQAAAAGVRRFVYLSSVAVHGDESGTGCPFEETDAPNPQSAYALSKLEAERALVALCTGSTMECVIIRPPLVYGPNARGNLAALVKWVCSGWPIPLGAVSNGRSLVAIDNLNDFIERCLTHPGAAGQIFLVSDGQDLSTPDLIRHIAIAWRVPLRLVSVPVPVLRGLGLLTGQSQTVGRLCGNLQLTMAKAQRVLQWAPPISVAEGMLRAAGRQP
ncbi:MAG: NAD-dependent epimerase/dehydratase family protein [Rhodoferax sp.]|nr:NAD-dependent epimerase/dehydratase family protein [Rhodoferax sp.]